MLTEHSTSEDLRQTGMCRQVYVHSVLGYAAGDGRKRLKHVIACPETTTIALIPGNIGTDRAPELKALAVLCITHCSIVTAMSVSLAS